mgnify:CR=1 FL=1
MERDKERKMKRKRDEKGKRQEDREDVCMLGSE